VLSLALCAICRVISGCSVLQDCWRVCRRSRIRRWRRAGATIAQSRPERANFLLSLFYAGPGSGILLSGLIAPFVLQAFGPGSWWIVCGGR
jgi:hypothetical protein